MTFKLGAFAHNTLPWQLLSDSLAPATGNLPSDSCIFSRKKEENTEASFVQFALEKESCGRLERSDPPLQSPALILQKYWEASQCQIGNLLDAS